MTLEEAIIHAEEVADRCAVTDGNIKCEIEHRQLAEWLKELKERREKDEQSKTFSCSEKPNRSDLISRQAAIDPEPSEITDEQAILHLQSTGWMQNHDREMYESGLREQLADDSGCYDSLIPYEDTINRQAAIDALLEEVRLVDGYYVENDEVIDKDDAIEAIRLLPSAQPEPCEDAVSRAAVIDLIEASDLDLANRMDNQAVCGFVKMIPSVTPKRKTMICGACSHSDSETLYATNPPRIQCRKTGNLHFATDVCDCENMNNQHEISHSDEDAVNRKRLKRQ